MERIDRRALNLVPQTAALAAWQVMRSKVRAYSHQGHGPRADHQAGYISATSGCTTSLANGSRFSNRSSLVKTAVYVVRPGHGSLRGQHELPQHLVRPGARAL